MAIGVTGTLALTKLLHPGTNKVTQLPNIANPLATMLPDEVETYCASLNKENCVLLPRDVHIAKQPSVEN